MDDTDWGAEKKNKIVLIGRNIDKEVITQQLQNCVASDLEE